ncbi:MAG TPA: S8 family serine peptidase [Herpetosiphonaceae bacterium]
MRVFALFVLFTALVLSFVGIGATQVNALQVPHLRLHRATFDARAAGGSVPQAALNAASGSHAIIQFRGPITPADRAALEQAGVEVLEYVPDYAYLVRGGASELAAAARLPQVYARVPFTHADKLAPALLSALSRGETILGNLRIVGWPGDRGELERGLRSVAVNATGEFSAAALVKVASLPAVRWIEPEGQPRLLNDVARTIMRVDQVWQNRRLYGAGQTIAVTDSGMDTGDPATISPDFAGRLVATHVLSDGGDLADQHGHGTHVAGSVAGAGVQSGANPAQRQYTGSFAGAAPEARLVIQAFEVLSNGAVVGLNPDYYQLFTQSYNDGARLHTNSWGDYTGPATDPQAKFGGYPYGSQRVDQFMWDHPDMTIFFAAGNSGTDGKVGSNGFCSGGNGVIDPDSLLAPGTAKNVITVGASENLRLEGGMSDTPWFFLHPNWCFGTQPIATDLISNNVNGMAAFSSRGPTDDGRIKPDLVAPGTNIVSNKSHYPNASPQWGNHETNAHYVYSGGTSMATPLTAGAGVLTRQWLTLQGIANPSAAVVKATMLNTTADMGIGQYGTGTTQEMPNVRPNTVAGWGRTDVGFIAAPLPYKLWADDHTAGLSTGQIVEYSHTLNRPLDVLSSDQPLRVMLTWTDPAASLSAAKQLVNDLDLVVIGPDGTQYYGNNIATGDRTNNVEGVVINAPALGLYRVQVRGFNVPIATQPYGLTVGGPINQQGQLTVTKAANPAVEVEPGGLITYTLSLSAGSKAITRPTVLTDTLPLNVDFVSASNGGVRTGAGGSVIKWSIPGLAANETITRSLVVRVNQGTPENTQIVNADYGAENDFDVPGVGAPVTVTVRTVPKGVLTLSKTANPSAEVAPSDLITYTLTVGAQNAAVSGVVLADTLPVDTTFVSASGAYTRSGPGNSIVSWNVGTLAQGQTTTRTLTVQVSPDAANGATISNATYRVSAADAPTVNGTPVNVTVRRPQTGALTLSKTADPGTEVFVRKLITYTLTVGAQDTSYSDVALTDVVPVNTEFVSASGSYTLSGPNNNIVSWNVGALSSGQRTTRTLTVRVLPDTADGATISNSSYQASATGAATVSGPPVNVTARRLPTGTLLLSGTVDPDTEIIAGQVLTYTLTVQAQGARLEGVVLRDVVPTGTDFVSASGAYTRSGADNSIITWNIGTLEVGQTATRTLTVFVPENTPDETMLVNDGYQVSAENAATVNGQPINVRVRAATYHMPRVWVPFAVGS